MTPDERNRLHQADEAASIAHDYIWPQSKTSRPTKQEASDAIWRIHELLRPMIERDEEAEA